MKSILIIFLICLVPIISLSQIKEESSKSEKITLQTFRTILSQNVKVENFESYFHKLGYKYYGVNNISKYGLEGYQVKYVGNHSAFTIDVIKKLKLNILYQTYSLDEYNNILSELQLDDEYKVVDNSQDNSATSTTYANRIYIFILMQRKMQDGLQYTIGVADKINNVLVKNP